MTAEQLEPPADLTTPVPTAPPAQPDPAPAAVPDPGRPVLDPEPEVIEPPVERQTPPAGVELTGQPQPIDGTVDVVDQPGTEVVPFEPFDVAEADENWTHDTLEFMGDVIGIRRPGQRELSGLAMATSKYVPVGIKNDLTMKFLVQHMSMESYGRVFSRMMDPDEPTYTEDTVGDLFNAILTPAVDELEAANAASTAAAG